MCHAHLPRHAVPCRPAQPRPMVYHAVPFDDGRSRSRPMPRRSQHQPHNNRPSRRSSPSTSVQLCPPSTFPCVTKHIDERNIGRASAADMLINSSPSYHTFAFRCWHPRDVCQKKSVLQPAAHSLLSAGSLACVRACVHAWGRACMCTCVVCACAPDVGKERHAHRCGRRSSWQQYSKGQHYLAADSTHCQQIATADTTYRPNRLAPTLLSGQHYTNGHHYCQHCL